MNNPTPKQEGEPESEPEQESETPSTPSMAEQRDAIQKRESKSATPQKPVSKAESPQSAIKQPESPKPEQPTKKGKKPEDCFEVDFCEDFYIFMEQWQKQNIAQSQKTQEAYSQCCPKNEQQAKEKAKDFQDVKEVISGYDPIPADKEEG
jgi:hypothetical protein